MTNRIARLVEFLAQQRKVVVRISHLRVFDERGLVGLHRLVLLIAIVEQDAEVVEQQGIVSACADRVGVGARGLVEATKFMQQAPLVHACIDARRIGRNRGVVGT